MRSKSGNHSPDAAREAFSGTQTVSLRPGRFYRRTWILPICVVGLALIVIGTPEPSTADFLEAAVVVCALVSLSMLLPLYYRRVRTIVADSRGVRLLVGQRVRKDLGWARISRVNMGPRHYRNGLLGVYDGFGLMVVGRNLADSINLVDSWFKSDANDLSVFSRGLERIAESRSIPVYTRTGRW